MTRPFGRSVGAGPGSRWYVSRLSGSFGGRTILDGVVSTRWQNGTGARVPLHPRRTTADVGTSGSVPSGGVS